MHLITAIVLLVTTLTGVLSQQQQCVGSNCQQSQCYGNQCATGNNCNNYQCNTCYSNCATNCQTYDCRQNCVQACAPSCQTNTNCCNNYCYNNCQSASCTYNCLQNCQPPPTPPVIIPTAPPTNVIVNNTNNNLVNLTTHLTINNVVHNINNISVPVFVNTTNINNIGLVSNMPNITYTEPKIIVINNTQPERNITVVVNKDCCQVTVPQRCYYDQARNYKCEVRRFRHCGDICNTGYRPGCRYQERPPHVYCPTQNYGCEDCYDCGEQYGGGCVVNDQCEDERCRTGQGSTCYQTAEGVRCI